MWKYLCWPCKIPSFLLRGTDQEVPLNVDGGNGKKGVKRRSGINNKTTVPSTTNGTFVHATDKSRTDAVSMQSEVETPPDHDKDMTPEPKLNANGEIIYEDKENNNNNGVSTDIEHGRQESHHEKNVPSLIIPSTHKIERNHSDCSQSSSNNGPHVINVNPTDTPVAM